METPAHYTAFEGTNLVFRGALSEIVPRIKKRIGKAENSGILIFSSETGRTLDFNFQGTEKDVLKRLETFASSAVPDAPSKESTGPGRPKLGVVAREISLLPRHWEWLASQSGGASATLRRLVDEARKKFIDGNSAKQAQERTYRFMSVLAGDAKGYEEALRALYKKDEKSFLAQIEHWPADVRSHAATLAKPAFEKSATPAIK